MRSPVRHQIVEEGEVLGVGHRKAADHEGVGGLPRVDDLVLLVVDAQDLLLEHVEQDLDDAVLRADQTER